MIYSACTFILYNFQRAEKSMIFDHVLSLTWTGPPGSAPWRQHFRLTRVHTKLKLSTNTSSCENFIAVLLSMVENNDSQYTLHMQISLSWTGPPGSAPWRQYFRSTRVHTKLKLSTNTSSCENVSPLLPFIVENEVIEYSYCPLFPLLFVVCRNQW